MSGPFIDLSRGLRFPARVPSWAQVRRCARSRAWMLVLAGALMIPTSLSAQDITWQDAVARLAAERTSAEACVSAFKRNIGQDTLALSRGELAYAEAKAEVDAVIAGLVVVLAQSGTPPDLTDLEARLTRGFEARQAFCAKVEAMLPEDEGTKNVLVQIVGAAIEPLIEAIVEIYKFESEQDQLLRKTIQTQLEATRWSDFANITA